MIPPPAVWFGGEGCELKQLERWLSSEERAGELVAAIRQEIAHEALDQFEASSGLSANTDLVAFAIDFWEPYADPVARAQWALLVTPAARWYSGQLRCIDAWRLRYGRDPDTQASLEDPLLAFLEAQRSAEEMRAETWAVIDLHAVEFDPLAREMLPR